MENIHHISALHSSCPKADHHVRLKVFSTIDDKDDDISISSDDSMSSLDSDDPNTAFSPEYLSISTEMMSLAINATSSDRTTPSLQSIGSFTCHNLQKLDT